MSYYILYYLFSYKRILGKKIIYNFYNLFQVFPLIHNKYSEDFVTLQNQLKKYIEWNCWKLFQY